MKIKPYKQTYSDSCLPVCLLMLSDQRFSQEDEVELSINGTKRFRDSYALGILDCFSTKHETEVEVFVDNKYFSRFLGGLNSNDKISLINQKITPKFIEENKKPFILYLDKHFLGTYDHSPPHFVIVEDQPGNNFNVVDPWVGRRRIIKQETIFSAVGSLRNYLRYCPLVISLKYSS